MGGLKMTRFDHAVLVTLKCDTKVTQSRVYLKLLLFTNYFLVPSIINIGHRHRCDHKGSVIKNGYDL